MHIVKGNLYTDDEMSKYDHIGFTANSCITKDGKLVMGAGAAKVVRDKFKGIDLELGNKIEHLGVFKIVISDKNKIFAFQTKTDWKARTDLELLEKSIDLLCRSARTYKLNSFALNFPAIGHGGIDRDTVLKMIERVPNNVFFYEL